MVASRLTWRLILTQFTGAQFTIDEEDGELRALKFERGGSVGEMGAGRNGTVALAARRELLVFHDEFYYRRLMVGRIRHA